jgi:hypothetical protein
MMDDLDLICNDVSTLRDVERANKVDTSYCWFICCNVNIPRASLISCCFCVFKSGLANRQRDELQNITIFTQVVDEKWDQLVVFQRRAK